MCRNRGATRSVITHMTRHLIAAAALVGALALPTVAGAVTPVTPPFQTFADSTGAGAVAADGGYLAWSDRAPGGGYRLTVTRPDGTAGPAKIATRKLPFDVNLGPGASGHELAVYSRCETDSSVASRRRGCRIVTLDLVTGRETTLKLGAGSKSEYLPAIDGSTLASISVPTKGTKTASLVVRDLKTGRVTTQQTHPLTADYRPLAVDTDGTHAAVLWTADGESIKAEGLAYAVFTQRIGAKARIGDVTEITGDGCGNEDFVGVSLFGGAAYTIVEGGARWQLERITLGGARPVKTYGPKVLYGKDADGSFVVDQPFGFAVDGQGYVSTETAITRFTLGSFAKKPAAVYDDSGCA